ncbi:hypothetical protein WICANDRAFT_60422 [Wickerhamomyces anomalus NRRL Y-366-8]|uniref:Hpc2-related domain-containing protein n=1 Tax=Wickerhamomyces anomalus (strain ATCC 58044 / CBS 1984 / NCYC 433 / NRRL Y-366-8) TaxID=683960 RepID=A0A1E3PBN0_WICAA|nr:uncharacterized protein WICANDRAFT_60422 [Wickerhamomyces anomalus NRRL Y-366-8]ODQ62362.1 hypothetical protein WICANDRAFT_60422 [Wickerhamomyces anomalus NRRL Y-366-8]
MAKKGISISSLLGPKDSKESDDDLVPISSSEMESSPKKKVVVHPETHEVITIDDSDDSGPELLTQDKFEADASNIIGTPSTLKKTDSGKIDIKSMLASNENTETEKPAPKKRKPRAAKKEAEPKPEPKKRAPRGSKKKAAEEAAAAKAKAAEEASIEEDKKGKEEESKDKPASKKKGKASTNATTTEDDKAAPPGNNSKEPSPKDQPVATTTTEPQNNEKVVEAPKDTKPTEKPIPILNEIAKKSSSFPETPAKEHSYVSPGPPVSSPYVLQSQNDPKLPKPNDIKSLINTENEHRIQLLPSPIPNNNPPTANNNPLTNTSAPITSNNTTTNTTPKPKPKAQKKPSITTDNKEVKPKGKPGPKKKDDKQETPAPLTFNQIQNQNLLKPDPKANQSLPSPEIVEVQKSPAQETTPQPEATKPTEPIIALHVPLKPPNAQNSPDTIEQVGATQVVFNVLKMAEDKYGWKNLHPEASKYALELMNDEDIDDDDDDEDDEKEEEEPEPQQRIDGRRLQKGKPKIGQYDKEDPFIDDSEMIWEEQRASTKDGFFVFYGPLVEEGKSAKIERADGTIKRNRKRVAGTSNVNAGNAKRRATNSKQTTPKLLVPIAPAAGNAVPANPTNVDIAPKV